MNTEYPYDKASDHRKDWVLYLLATREIGYLLLVAKIMFGMRDLQWVYASTTDTVVRTFDACILRHGFRILRS